MLIPDYLAIGTLIIFSLAAMVWVYSKKGSAEPAATGIRSLDKLKDPDRTCSSDQPGGAAR